MGCFKPKPSSEPTFDPNPSLKNPQHQLLLQIPACKVHLMEAGESLELANGNFTIFRVLEEDVSLATIIKVGDTNNEVQWPLTKDEPVVKIDGSSYLFTLPMKDGELLSYGVSFFEQYSGNLGVLDSFLMENSCFSGFVGGSGKGSSVEWREFAPNVEDYNSFVAKAIAGGTGHIVKGIFKCSNAYTNQVQKGGEMMLTSTTKEKRSRDGTNNSSKHNNNKVNKSLKRVRKLSMMTEKLSKTMLNGVGIATGSVMAPMVKSRAGKKMLSMVPGEVLLASLDAVNKILDAAEVAEKRVFSATSKATSRMVSHRFGESAGEATEDAMATAGHCVCAAWNIFKIRKAINPASSVSAGMLQNSHRS